MKRVDPKPTALQVSSSAAIGPVAPVKPTRPVVVYLQGHKEMVGGLRAILKVLNQAGTVLDFPWEEIRYEHMETIRAKLIEAYAPATARKALTAVRGVLKTTWKMQRIDRETFERTCAVDPIPGDSEPTGRMLSPDEIRSLLDTEDPRDSAIIALAVFAGLRRVELSRLDMADLSGFRKLTIRKGKGSKFREVFLPAIVQDHLAPWIAVRGTDPGPLFWQAKRGGHVTRGSRLSISGVWRAVLSAAADAKIELTPHDLRRTYASTLLDRGVDLPTVQKLMGHADPSTTVKYDRRGDAPKIDAGDRLADAFKEK